MRGSEENRARRRKMFEQGLDLEGIGKRASEVLYRQADGTGVMGYQQIIGYRGI